MSMSGIPVPFISAKVLPLGVEPRYHVLQTCALTTLARVTKANHVGVEPTPIVSRTIVLPLY